MYHLPPNMGARSPYFILFLRFITNTLLSIILGEKLKSVLTLTNFIEIWGKGGGETLAPL